MQTDREKTASAVKEARAVLTICETLAAVPTARRRERVFRSAQNLVEADAQVPGVIAEFLRPRPAQKE